MESSVLSEVDDTSILRTGLPTPLCLSSQLATRLSPRAPRSGLERSDFVLWHSATFGDGRGPRRMTTPNPLDRLVFCHCDHGAGERAVGLSQLIQNREVIGVGDRYQVAGDMPLRSVGMVIAAARDHRRQLAG